MKTTEEHNNRIANMSFASVYPHYVTKVTSKGRTEKELHQVIEWLTGFDEKKFTSRFVIDTLTPPSPASLALDGMFMNSYEDLPPT